jgi:hypothetical protein
MSKIIYFSGKSLLHSGLDVPGLDNFLKIQKYFHPNAGMKDRSGIIDIPFKTKILNPLPVMNPNLQWHVWKS